MPPTRLAAVRPRICLHSTALPAGAAPAAGCGFASAFHRPVLRERPAAATKCRQRISPAASSLRPPPDTVRSSRTGISSRYSGPSPTSSIALSTMPTAPFPTRSLICRRISAKSDRLLSARLPAAALSLGSRLSVSLSSCHHRGPPRPLAPAKNKARLAARPLVFLNL